MFSHDYIYQIEQGMSFVEKYLGSGLKILAKSERTIWSRRHNLQGLKWNVVLKVDPPYLYRNSSDNSLHGYNQDVWSQLEKRLNVSSNLIEVERYGRLIGDERWDGLLGLIQDDVADITMTPISYTHARFSKQIDIKEKPNHNLS